MALIHSPIHRRPKPLRKAARGAGRAPRRRPRRAVRRRRARRAARRRRARAARRGSSSTATARPRARARRTRSRLRWTTAMRRSGRARTTGRASRRGRPHLLSCWRGGLRRLQPFRGFWRQGLQRLSRGCGACSVALSGVVRRLRRRHHQREAVVDTRVRLHMAGGDNPPPRRWLLHKHDLHVISAVGHMRQRTPCTLAHVHRTPKG